MSKFKKYTRTNIAEMRDVTDSEVMSKSLNSKISISPADKENGSPKMGDKIARNPLNHNDQWLVAEQYFNENFIEQITNKEIK